MEPNDEEKRQLSYQVGVTPLKHIPITRDQKLSFTQRPLLDSSIRFDL